MTITGKSDIGSAVKERPVRRSRRVIVTRAEERQSREEWLSRLIAGFPHPIVAFDRDLIAVAVSPKYPKLVGKRSSSILGKHASEVFCIKTADTGAPWDISRALGRCLSENVTAEFAPLCLRSRTGEEMSVKLTVVPQSGFDADGGLTVFVDPAVTDEQASELRDSALSFVGHELRTPLLHIKGFASSLLQNDVQWDDATRRDFLQTIDMEADRLSALVENLLDISRMRGGRPSLNLEVIRPGELVDAALRAASPYLENHVIHVDISESLSELQADMTRMISVLVNLLENASKYSEEGTEINVSISQRGNEAIFSVSDQGFGISIDAQQHVFDLFYRAVRPQDRGGKSVNGTGLGLTLSLRAVEAHGGRMWVESDGEGLGSTFHFALPVRETAAFADNSHRASEAGHK